MDDAPNRSPSALTLWGYRYSVYTRIAKMVLALRDVPYHSAETNPFDDPPDPALARITRFGRVPVLDHDGFVLSETTAICRYVAAAFPGAALVPATPRAAARMDQVIVIIDAYGYQSMVRQVFSHAVFRPMIHAPTDSAQIAKGLADAAPVLATLNTIAAEGLVLTAPTLTLADLHLAPMIGYFAMAPEGHAALGQYPALLQWWAHMQHLPAYLKTDPGLATFGADT